MSIETRTPEQIAALIERLRGHKRKSQPVVSDELGAALGLTSPPMADNEYPMPEGYDDTRTVTRIHAERLGIISDLHVPTHDVAACNIALRHLRSKSIDTLVINGDLMDMYALSRHGRDARTYGLEYEMSMGRKVLESIRAFFGDGVAIHYVEGNHELWWKRYLRNARIEMDMARTLAEALGLSSLGITYHDQGMGLRCGKLSIIHGHELGGSGIYVARQKLMRAKTNIVFGHHHTTQDWTERTFGGDTIGAWAVGCLCQRTPEYRPLNEWTHGFAYAEFDHGADGGFTLDNRTIINGQLR